jgi:hypothetical protein
VNYSTVKSKHTCNDEFYSTVSNIEGKVKVKLYAMKEYGGVDVEIHIFLTSALAGGEWSASRPGRSTAGERAPGNHCMNPRASLDVEKILDPTGTQLRPLGRLPRSQSLYRLSYSGVLTASCASDGDIRNWSKVYVI